MYMDALECRSNGGRCGGVRCSSSVDGRSSTPHHQHQCTSISVLYCSNLPPTLCIALSPNPAFSADDGDINGGSNAWLAFPMWCGCGSPSPGFGGERSRMVTANLVNAQHTVPGRDVYRRAVASFTQAKYSPSLSSVGRAS